jgi:hypothetical protein
MQSSMHTRQVVALSPGLPAEVVDEVLTATESALRRLGACDIRLDMSQPGLVVLADLPLTVAAGSVPSQRESLV